MNKPVLNVRPLYELGPVARRMAMALQEAADRRANPPRPAIVTVDIPPRPLPGRKTVPSIDPASVPYPRR